MNDQEELGHEWSCEGKYTEGVLDSYDVSPKELAARSGIHESTLSRFFNERKPIRDRQLLRLGIAIGELKAQRQKKSPTAGAELKGKYL